jgi:hypothetical protein
MSQIFFISILKHDTIFHHTVKHKITLYFFACLLNCLASLLHWYDTTEVTGCWMRNFQTHEVNIKDTSSWPGLKQDLNFSTLTSFSLWNSIHILNSHSEDHTIYFSLNGYRHVHTTVDENCCSVVFSIYE